MVWFFCFFLVSGFCSLMYEVIWLRLAMAQFGVTTPMVSLVLSTFMLGLGLGSWASGRLIKAWEKRLLFPPLRLYALMEFLIGLSAFAVVFEFAQGGRFLHHLESTHGVSSLSYYGAAGLWIALSLLPWCACMGATFPCALFAIKRRFHSQSANSFSYLYLANVLGAMAGSLLPLLIIERSGFRSALAFGAALNFLLAICAFSVGGLRASHPAIENDNTDSATADVAAQPDSNPSVTISERKRLLLLLFWTGLTSMAAEVVWVRMFTAWLGTVVYAFAGILALYLGATYVGSWFYRRWIYRRWRVAARLDNRLWALLAVLLLIPLFTADPRLYLPSLLRLFLGIVPFSATLGFITPCLLDRISRGDPNAAGSAYGLNIIGCILGPLLSGFILLPTAGERGSLIILAVPLLVAASLFALIPLADEKRSSGIKGQLAPIVASALSLLLVFSTKDFATQFPIREERRDYTATVIATGSSHEGKRLLVNGVGITNLTPETKVMAHLPLVLLGRTPANALDICFGMGTTYRSLLSWGIPSTAVELVPGVPSLYGYFHADGPHLLQSPLSHLIIDDGRLYMERSSEQFDVITIDPPPPVEAAGSSLLYSVEFYATAKRHLRPDGILQQWIPAAEPVTLASVAKALHESFPYVRVFGAVDVPGHHFLASSSPIVLASPAVLASRMPADAAADFVEWGPSHTASDQLSDILANEVTLDSLVQMDPAAPALQDDHPVNEYFLIRRLSDPAFRRKAWRKLFRAHEN
jgi:spermidine synthase